MTSENYYCEPWNAGLASETPAVQRRLARLLEALTDEINENIVKGRINQDLADFRYKLRKQLEGDGWTFHYGARDKLRCKAPKGRKLP